MTKTHYRPEGWPIVTPRIVVDDPEALVGFIQQVFGATGAYQPERPTELWLDGSVLMVSASVAREVSTAFLYLYVEDTDVTYRRALAAGATSMEAPRDLPYGDRRAMVRDAWGNTWQVATHSGQFTS